MIHDPRLLRRKHDESSQASPTRWNHRIWEYLDEVRGLADSVGDINHGIYRGSGVFTEKKLVQYFKARDCHYAQKGNLLQISDLTMHPFRSSKTSVYLSEWKITVPTSLINAIVDYATLESCVTKLDEELQKRGIAREAATEQLNEADFLALVQLEPGQLWAVTTQMQAKELLRKYRPSTK